MLEDIPGVSSRYKLLKVDGWTGFSHFIIDTSAEGYNQFDPWRSAIMSAFPSVRSANEWAIANLQHPSLVVTNYA